VKIALASGTVALDASQSPPEQGSAYIKIRGLRLSRVFPAVKKQGGEGSARAAQRPH
jgi:hypothetical protein